MTTTTTTSIAVTSLAPLASQFNSAEANMRDLEALLAEATVVAHERHFDLLAAIAGAIADGLSQAKVAKAIKDGGAAFSKDLVGHAVRSWAVFLRDEKNDDKGTLYALRLAVTNAATNWKVALGTIDEALAEVNTMAKALEAIDQFRPGRKTREPKPPVPPVQEDEETEGDEDGEVVKTDAQRLVAIANIMGGMTKDGSADPEAVLAIIQGLQALVA